MASILTLARTSPKELKRFFKFGVVGGIGFVVDFGTFTQLHIVLGVWDTAAQVASFCAAVVSNFTWNRYWTYPDSRTKPLARQLSQFAVISVIGLAIRTPIFVVVKKPYVELLQSTGVASLLRVPAGTLASYLALATAVLVVLFWNFFINRYWTYNDVQ